MWAKQAKPVTIGLARCNTQCAWHKASAKKTPLACHNKKGQTNAEVTEFD